MNGVRGFQIFEQHLCEIMYRRMFPCTDLLLQFLEDLKLIYTLDGPTKYTINQPGFFTMQDECVDTVNVHRVD